MLSDVEVGLGVEIQRGVSRSGVLSTRYEERVLANNWAAGGGFIYVLRRRRTGQSKLRHGFETVMAAGGGGQSTAERGKSPTVLGQAC